ncbi:hypothetical protein PM082_022599 [Marasmius tenuissimus]|nr:hypothetical protein PM082_022599 [Marasmius tenuissimus]
MLNLSKYSAWVSIDGVPTEEYGVEVSEGQNKVTCWIPSEEGKTFQIMIKDTRHHKPVAASFYVDGTRCGRKALYGKKLETLCKSGIRVSTFNVRPFTFSRMKTTDEDSLECSASSDIGEIKVEVHQATIKPSPSQTLNRPRTVPSQPIVHERLKKAVDHQTTFGEAVETRQIHFVDIKTHGSPKAVFCFKYRPLGMLQANGIAPPPERTTNDVTRMKPDPDDIIEISDEDESEELERLRKRVKTLEGKEAERAAKRVKREPEVKHELEAGEVIDLTDL